MWFVGAFVLTFIGSKESDEQERYKYDIFSLQAAHAEVPYDSNYIPGCSATGATSSASCSTDSGSGTTGGTGDSSSGGS